MSVEADTVDTDASETTGAESTDAEKEAAEGRSRSRRSPRHLRAAGQKRKKEQQDQEAEEALAARYPEDQEVQLLALNSNWICQSQKPLKEVGCC